MHDSVYVICDFHEDMRKFGLSNTEITHLLFMCMDASHSEKGCIEGGKFGNPTTMIPPPEIVQGLIEKRILIVHESGDIYIPLRMRWTMNPDERSRLRDEYEYFNAPVGD